MNAKNALSFSLVLCLAAAPVLAAGTASHKAVSLSSPDGKLSVSFALKMNPQPYLMGERAYYRVSYKGRPVLTDSPLGLDLAGGDAMERDLDVVKTGRASHDSSWENAFGAKRHVPDRYNQVIVSLRERRPPGRRMDIVFRAYNEGIAFRYVLPAQEHLGKFAIASENTGFYFDRDVSVWALNMGRFNTHNEGEYSRIRIGGIKPASIINLPLLIEVPGGLWAAILEADLTDYAGMYLGGAAGFPNGLVTRLSVAARGSVEQAVVGETPKATPWRVLMVGETPGALIESNYLVLNLNPPCAIADLSWIKARKTAWDWWSGSFASNVSFAPGMNTQTMEHYIDFAAAHHIGCMLIDGGWYLGTSTPDSDDVMKSVPEVDMPHILAHAREKGVDVMLWADWHPLERQLEAAMALYERWGVVGVKIDGMNRDDQQMVNLYAKWVRKAAEHHLVVDLHGAYKPTGLERTYPNLLTIEGVMGMEYNKWSERVTPEYTATIPFTRMLAGPMDFTPGAFHNAARGEFMAQDIAPMSQGTRARQLAMYVIYQSPLAMVSDYPEAYENQPGFEFIEKVPTVWDDTKVLSGEPAKHVAIARRSGPDWYVGAMADWDARDIKIGLGFLGSGAYEAQIFADGPGAEKTATSLSIVKKRVKAEDTLSVHLAPGGGAAVILSRVSE